MKKIATAAALLSLAAVSGCTSFRAGDVSAAPPRGETTIILGVHSKNYRVQIFPGKIKDGVFRQNQLRLATFYGAATDGYVVGHAKPGDTLAITMIRYVAQETDVLGLDFVPCAGLKTMVFQVPPTGAAYLGDVSYQPSGNGLSIRYSEDLAAAQAYLNAKNPALGKDVRKVSYELMPANMPCTTTIVVPVYV